MLVRLVAATLSYDAAKQALSDDATPTDEVTLSAACKAAQKVLNGTTAEFDTLVAAAKTNKVDMWAVMREHLAGKNAAAGEQKAEAETMRADSKGDVNRSGP